MRGFHLYTFSVAQSGSQAQQIENIQARRVNGISQNLHKALAVHSRHAHDDITASLIEHARASLIYQRTMRRELEALRNDVKAITQPVRLAPKVNPSINLFLSSSPLNGSAQGSYGPSSPAVPSSSASAVYPNAPPSTPRTPRTPGHNGPMSHSDGGPSTSSSSAFTSPRSPAPNGAGDGTRSLYIDSRPGPVMDPLGGGTPTSGSVRGGFGDTTSQSQTLGRSFVQPVRGRIDQREAARKLANFL